MYENKELLEKISDMVVVNVKHTFSPEEIDQEGQMLAQAVNDKASEENNKKVAMAAFKNKIDTFDGKIKLHASNINHGFTYIDKPAEMYRDYARAKRVYFDKATGDFLSEESFHASDFQKKLDFEQQEEQLRLDDIERQQQIEENNRAGDHAEGELDTLDEIILDKKKEGRPEMRPVPKDNLPDNYGKNFEADELPDLLNDDVTDSDGDVIF